jgi:hypothetical protein
VGYEKGFFRYLDFSSYDYSYDQSQTLTLTVNGGEGISNVMAHLNLGPTQFIKGASLWGF